MKHYFILIVSVSFLATGCHWDCAISSDTFTPTSGEESANSATYPSSLTCSGIAVENTSNDFDEMGQFHNAFLDYVDVPSFNFQDKDSLLDHVVASLVDFAMIQRENYDFLPDDSAACSTVMANYIGSQPAVIDSEYHDQNPLIEAPSGSSSGFSAYVDSLRALYANLESGNIDLHSFIDEIKLWESDIIQSTLNTTDKNTLLKIGSISRYSMYYWGCHGDALTRRPFWSWLKDNWYIVGAYDLVGGLCCGGPIGAAISSAGGAGIGWMLNWPQ